MSVLDSAVTGMLGNSNWLSTIAQNVANSNTTGYKNVETEFSALVDASPGGQSAVAGVASHMVSLNNLQGQVETTQTGTNLAVQGSGFFIVQDGSGNTYLTRNGSFVPDAQGNLVNAAGYYLMGSNIYGQATVPSVNSTAGLTKVNVQGTAASAQPSTTANIVANLPSTAAIVPAAQLPSTNAANATYTAETTLVAYDNLGGTHTLNVYFSNEGGGNWEATVYDASTAAAGGGFPYSSGPLAPASTLTYSMTNGSLTGGSPLTITVPGGQNLTLDLSQTTQLATKFAVNASTINGNAPGSLTGVAISADGIMSFQYGNGTSANAYVIPLANVPSPDNMTSQLGDAYQTNYSSGALQVGNANSGGLGSVDSSALESSTVDLATELTNMVQAQSAYQANSRVFQTGAKLLDILNNLQT